MKRLHLLLLVLPAVAGASIATACAPSASEETTESSQLIVDGVEATKHEYAALVDIERTTGRTSRCSGSVIAPRVVLTAGHCIVNARSFRVETPFAKEQKARGLGMVYDYVDTGTKLNPEQHDIGLVFLDRPIVLTKYPRLQRRPLAKNTRVTKIGRVKDGEVSDTTLFESRAMKVRDGKSLGFPYSYVSDEVLQPGDSGGPDVLTNTDPPTIVAVNSAAGGGTEILARVDLLIKWIDEQVAVYGGGYSDADGGVDAGVDADVAPDAGTDAGEPGATAPPKEPSKRAEQEEEPEERPDAGKKETAKNDAPSGGCSMSSSPERASGASSFFVALLLAALAKARRKSDLSPE